jgi:Fe-S cluster assembly protein SufD
VFVDGQPIASLSTEPAAKGISVRTADDLPDPGLAPTALTALTNAIAEPGTQIDISGQNSEPHELVFVGSGRHLAPQARLVISAASGSNAQLIFRFADVDDTADNWLNLNIEILQQARSTLELFRLQTHGASCDQTALHRASLDQDAKLVAHNVEAGGRLIRNEYEIALTGTNACAEINAVAVTADKEHCDIRIAADHRAPGTLSRQNHRAILSDSSRSVFNGKVTVREQAQQIDARQRSDNLLLSPGAEADTKPELEIYADQVVCSHGATVGELDEDQLFYLRARGIDATAARGILTAAFADTVLELAGSEEFIESARKAVRARLPRSADLR